MDVSSGWRGRCPTRAGGGVAQCPFSQRRSPPLRCSWPGQNRRNVPQLCVSKHDLQGFKNKVRDASTWPQRVNHSTLPTCGRPQTTSKIPPRWTLGNPPAWPTPPNRSERPSVQVEGMLRNPHLCIIIYTKLCGTAA